MMQSEEIRAKFLEFFRKRGHVVLPSAAIVPENDATTLFTGSGMQPMLPYLLGQSHPLGTRFVNLQKCFRAEDIEEVGDNRHTTFFEMMGNWSLGDYFKQEALEWFFEFLTVEVGLDPKRLYVTAFAGDQDHGLPKDEETVDIWKKLFLEKAIVAKDVMLDSEEHAAEGGMQGGRIFYYGKKNWWSRWGGPEKMPAGEPGGPDSEFFYEFPDVVHNSTYGKHCHPNCDCGRFLEIGNCVFMVYRKNADGTFSEMEKKNVDFGGGFERLVMTAQGKKNIFETDLFVMEKIREFSRNANEVAERVVADHMRAAVFMIADGIIPSNTDRGYVLRRLLRRSVRFADKLGMKHGALFWLARAVIERFAPVYPEILSNAEKIKSEIDQEESKFRKTLDNGLKEFEKITFPGKEISGQVAFDLYQSYGFPVEMTVELAQEKDATVDLEAYAAFLAKHQELSRSGSEKKFKGGLAGHSDQELKYHTATHLLNAALRTVLGKHVLQKGSNITAERMRFDFSHTSKMTPEELEQVETLVNQKIKEALPVTFKEIPLEVAKAAGAIGVFDQKYADIVKVYTIGHENDPFSMELCGGPHVENTQELGTFKILKEEAVSAGVRRIKAVLL